MLASLLQATFVEQIVILMIPHTNFWWFCIRILTFFIIPHTNFREWSSKFSIRFNCDFISLKQTISIWALWKWWHPYVEVLPPLYISCASPKQTKKDQHQETLEPAGNKGQWIKKATKVNESKWWKRNSLEFRCLLLNSFNRWHLLGPAQYPLNAIVTDCTMQFQRGHL